MPFDISERRQWQEQHTEIGVWCPVYINEEDSGARVKVAPARNKNFQKKYRGMEKIALRQKRKKKFEDLPVEVQTKLFYESLFETVCLDWQGVLDGDVELEFTLKNFLMVMEDVWGFADEVVNYSMAEETFKTENHEEVEKNFSRPSSGNLNQGQNIASVDPTVQNLS